MRLTQDGKLNTNLEMDALVIAILKKDQNGFCGCSKPLSEGFQLTHKRYGEDIGLKDLELKCGACHASEHGYVRHTGTLRMA